MFNRYKYRRVLTNNQEMYEELFRERNVKFIKQYNTPTFNYPTQEDYNNITILAHTWKLGDRFYKLAHTYYGDSKDWWIIAKFNATPTESHVKIGDTIYIPKPISKLLNYMTG